MQASYEVRSYTNFIGGKWVDSKGGTIEGKNPATGALVTRSAKSTTDDVVHAIEEARRTFDSGVWSSRRPAERAKSIRDISELIRKHIDDLSLLLTLENGKPLTDAKGELLNAANVLEYYASAARHIVGRVPRYSGTDISLVVHEPIGVCGLIVPWNSPISLLSWKLGPALAAGCTVVIKPSSYTSGITMEFMKLVGMVEGIPAGVVNAVSGPGESVGNELVRSAKVDKVSFTGSTETGKKIMEMAAGNLKKINLECGGKSANIVFDDANTDAALRGAIWSIFRSAGQSCNAGSRLLVQETIYGPFMRSYVQAASAIRVGNGLDPGTEMGPIISETQMKRVLATSRPGRWTERGSLWGAAGSWRGTIRRGTSSSQRSSRTSTTTPGFSRRRFSGPFSACSPSATRTTPSPLPTTPSSGWQGTSGRGASPES